MNQFFLTALLAMEYTHFHHTLDCKGCKSLGETGRISVTGAISVSAVFFFLKIIILIDQIKCLVCLTANFVCQQKILSELANTRW